MTIGGNMTITTKTNIAFRIPEDSELLNTFIKTNNIGEWKEIAASDWIIYQRSDTVHTGVNRNEKENTYENHGQSNY